MPLKYIPESLTNVLGMGVSASTFLLSSFEKLNLSIPVEILGLEADIIQITSGSMSLLLTLVLIRYRNANAVLKSAEAQIKMETARKMRLENDMLEHTNNKTIEDGQAR